MGNNLTFPLETQYLIRDGTQRLCVGSSEAQGLRPTQEDRRTVMLDAGIFGVYDGHGSDKVSNALAQELPQRTLDMLRRRRPSSITDAEWTQLWLDVDKQFVRDKEKDGSCAIQALVDDDDDGKPHVTVLHVGDSRALLIHVDQDAKHDSFTVLTHDHKPENANEYQRIVDADGHVSMSRVCGNLAISRAFGDTQFKEDEQLAPEKQMVIAVPEVVRTRIDDLKHTYLLLCCDGFFEKMDNEDVAKLVQAELRKQQAAAASPVDLADICAALIKESIRRDSHDNHTCMLIGFGDGRQHKRPLECRCGDVHEGAQDRGVFWDAYYADMVAHECLALVPPFIASHAEKKKKREEEQEAEAKKVAAQRKEKEQEEQQANKKKRKEEQEAEAKKEQKEQEEQQSKKKKKKTGRKRKRATSHSGEPSKKSKKKAA